VPKKALKGAVSAEEYSCEGVVVVQMVAATTVVFSASQAAVGWAGMEKEMGAAGLSAEPGIGVGAVMVRVSVSAS